MKSWIEISSHHLAANYKTLTRHAGMEGNAGATVLAVIKADAYGHGAALCSPVLAHAGANWLGVTDAAEGLVVREALAQANIAPPQQPRILIMSGSLPDEAEAIVANSLTPTAWSLDQLEPLTRAATRQRQQLPIHLELDTGMSRQGCVPGEELDRLLQWLAAQPALALDGVFTHFASAEIAGSHQTSRQQQRFEHALQQVRAAGLTPAWIHAGNSSTLDNPMEAAANWMETAAPEPDHWLARIARSAAARPMVRSGLALYGYCLPIEREQGYTGEATSQLASQLQPVMTWKARVLDVRSIAPGTRVGYNGTFTAPSPMRLALLPVGYADGLRRELSAASPHTGGWVSFGSARAPIVGRISMNLTTVNVTGLPTLRPGDEAHILGLGITADDHARLARTIPYEILCGIKAARRLR